MTHRIALHLSLCRAPPDSANRQTVFKAKVTGAASPRHPTPAQTVVDQFRIPVMSGYIVALAATERARPLISCAREMLLDEGVDERAHLKRSIGDEINDGLQPLEVVLHQRWAHDYTDGRTKRLCSLETFDKLAPGDPPLKRKVT